MVYDIIEALNKSGFSGYNKEVEEFIQKLIQNNIDKNKLSKKKDNTSNKRTEMENDNDINKEIIDKNEKEKMI